ncbi:DUF883 family protein [Falsiroseomonas oryzae]|uniref:DUF883 family protein n=1 Tax=Falsiroseomonas oryzae TaxID=2766473 RepID=UPI0022EA7585|nr:hypothetical protein [Roseomonas sp. MO-31]
MTKTSEGTGEDIAADLVALREDVARLSESISALLQSQAQGVARHVASAIDDAKVKLATTTDDVKSRVNAAGDEVEASIARNPLTAILISFGVGMALGMMSRLRH